MWWARFAPPDKTRPVVVVSRDDASDRRRLVTVAVVTTRIRDIPTEVGLGADEGLHRPSVLNCDDLRTIAKQLLVSQIGALDAAKLEELDDALRFALGLV